MGERPADSPRSDGGTVALAHNGNLINTTELAQMREDLVEERAGLTWHGQGRARQHERTRRW